MMRSVWVKSYIHSVVPNPLQLLIRELFHFFVELFFKVGKFSSRSLLKFRDGALQRFPDILSVLAALKAELLPIVHVWEA